MDRLPANAEQVVPGAGDEVGVDAVAGDPVQRAVVGVGVGAPEPGVTEVGQAGAELVAEQAEQAEDLVGVAGVVAHQLGWSQAGVLLEQPFEDVEAVAQGARDDDGVEAGELVGEEVEVGDAPAGSEVAGVGSGVQGADGDDEAQPVSGGDLAAAPGAGQVDVGLGVDEPGVGCCEGVGAQVVLLHPGQSGAGERRPAGLDERFETDVAGLRDEHRTDRQVQGLRRGWCLRRRG